MVSEMPDGRTDTMDPIRRVLARDPLLAPYEPVLRRRRRWFG